MPEDAAAYPEDPDEAMADPAFYRNGGVSLSEEELAALGDLHGKQVLVVQAGNGEDVLSLMNLGASVTVIDVAESIALAQELAASAGMQPRLLTGAPDAIAPDHRTGDYDAVYSGIGSRSWVGDITGWAEGIAACLKTGGRLVVYDEHPFANVFESDEEGDLIVVHPYLPEHDEDGIEVVPPGEEDDEGSRWTLGGLITALGANGLVTRSLAELPESNRFESNLDSLVTEGADFDQAGCVPGVLLLVATKL